MAEAGELHASAGERERGRREMLYKVVVIAKVGVSAPRVAI
jgi:hypothetical protein